jgi:hypothetical protein
VPPGDRDEKQLDESIPHVETGIFPGPPRRCPSCGGGGMSAVADGGGVHFRCRGCGAIVYVAHGRVWTTAEDAARSAR